MRLLDGLVIWAATQEHARQGERAHGAQADVAGRHFAAEDVLARRDHEHARTDCEPGLEHRFDLIAERQHEFLRNDVGVDRHQAALPSEIESDLAGGLLHAVEDAAEPARHRQLTCDLGAGRRQAVAAATMALDQSDIGHFGEMETQRALRQLHPLGRERIHEITAGDEFLPGLIAQRGQDGLITIAVQAEGFAQLRRRSRRRHAMTNAGRHVIIVVLQREMRQVFL